MTPEGSLIEIAPAAELSWVPLALAALCLICFRSWLPRLAPVRAPGPFLLNARILMELKVEGTSNYFSGDCPVSFG